MYFKLGLQNDFELLRILNYWSLNYRGSTVVVSFRNCIYFSLLGYKLFSCIPDKDFRILHRC